jgi:nitronate monooxygenase
MLPSQLRGRLRIPAMAAPMFLVSGPNLVVETCKAGVLGTFPTLNQRTADGYEQWLIKIRRDLGNADCAPFGAQFGIHHTNPRQAPDLALAIRYEVPLIVTTLGITRDITDAVHAYGGLVFHDATTIRHAKKALDANVDGVIAVCGGAGGHSGTYNPFAFITELRPLVGDKTLILAGAVSNGQSIAGAIASGADMVSLGTCFIATHESMAPDAQKAMILESTINDIVYTDKISGIGASFLAQTLSRASKSRGTHGVFDVAREISPKLWRDFWSAGQGVGGINSITSVAELCDRLAREYGRAVDRLTATALA